MSVTDLAVGFRGVILACLMIAAVLAPLNAWSYVRHHKATDEGRERGLAILKAVSVAVYGIAAFSSTWIRIDQEFSWPLPFLAVGLAGYVVYLFMSGDGDSKKKTDQPVDEKEYSPPLGIEP